MPTRTLLCGVGSPHSRYLSRQRRGTQLHSARIRHDDGHTGRCQLPKERGVHEAVATAVAAWVAPAALRVQRARQPNEFETARRAKVVLPTEEITVRLRPLLRHRLAADHQLLLRPVAFERVLCHWNGCELRFASSLAVSLASAIAAAALSASTVASSAKAVASPAAASPAAAQPGAELHRRYGVDAEYRCDSGHVRGPQSGAAIVPHGPMRVPARSIDARRRVRRNESVPRRATKPAAAAYAATPQPATAAATDRFAAFDASKLHTGAGDAKPRVLLQQRVWRCGVCVRQRNPLPRAMWKVPAGLLRSRAKHQRPGTGRGRSAHPRVQAHALPAAVC